MKRINKTPRNIEELFHFAVEFFEKNNLPYVIIGGLASGVWGDPRFTVNVDFLAYLRESDFEGFAGKAKKHGFTDPNEEEIVKRLKHSGVVKLKAGDLYIDVIVGNTDFERELFARKKEVEIFTRKVFIASGEDIVLSKLIAARTRDLMDIESILIRQKGKMDLAYLKRWASRLARDLDRPFISEKLGEMLKDIFSN